MRVTTMMPDVQYAMQQSEETLATATQQVSTSRRVNQLADDPSASASMVRSLAATANVDRYTANVSTVTARMQTADSALSMVVTSLNQAVSLGTGGANGTLTVAQRQVVAAQVQGVLSSVMAEANTSYQGSYLFGGSATGSPPFVNTAVAGGAAAYTYVGNSSVNSVQVGDAMSVVTNLPGDQVFTSGANVVGSLQGLIAALQTGSTTAIGAATTAVTAALNYVGQQRVPLDNSISQLSSQESYLNQESVTLTTQQTALVGVDIAKAATDLSQASMVHSAVLAVAGKVLPQTLLDYLK